MESLQPRGNTEPKREILVIDKARFTDQLEPEYEEMWTDLIASVRDTSEPFEKTLIPLWGDERLPQAFRDRAMLVGALCEGRFELGVESQCVTWGFGGSLESLKKFEGFDVEKFAEWYKTGLAYERQKEVDVFGLYTRLDWAFSLYKEDLLTDEDLDEVLNTLPPPPPDEKFIPGSEKPLSAEQVLRLELFGRIDDYDENYIKPDPRLYAWALEKMQAWFLHETGEKADLPQWLQNLSAEQGQEIFSKLISEKTSDKKDKAKARAWKEFKAVINHFGWGVVLSQDNLKYQSQLQHALEVVENIGSQNFEMQLSLLQNILNRKSEELLFLDYFEAVEKIIEASGDKDLRRILENEKEKLRQYKARQAERDAKSSQEQRKKKEAERAAAERNMQKLEGVLEIIRKHG